MCNVSEDPVRVFKQTKSGKHSLILWDDRNKVGAVKFLIIDKTHFKICDFFNIHPAMEHFLVHLKGHGTGAESIPIDEFFCLRSKFPTQDEKI